MASVAFIDTNAHPAAVRYYGQNAFEPIPLPKGGSVAISSLVAVPDPTLNGVLQSILKSVKEGGSILIVSHGTDWGLSIRIGSENHRVTKMETGSLANIRDNLNGQTSDSETAKLLSLAARDYQALKTNILAMRKLKLSRVDLRACNCGASEDTMDSLREFFDCDVLCAPDILDAFGMIEIGTPTRREADWESWRKKYTRANVEGTATGRFAYQIDISGNALLIHAMADSQDRVKEWVKATLGSASYTAGNPYFHALIRRKPYLFVFSAEPGFVEHLKQRTRDQAPKRGPVVIDPNAPLPRP